MKKKDISIRILSDRMVDAARWRDEVVNISKRMESIEQQIETPALEVIKQVERLADLLEDLKNSK
jgi:phosphopantetheine adenylyltransferase